MRLASVHIGDIVRVDDGMPYLAEVEEINERGVLAVRTLIVRPCYGSRSLRAVKAREVVAHWRRATKGGV